MKLSFSTQPLTLGSAGSAIDQVFREIGDGVVLIRAGEPSAPDAHLNPDAVEITGTGAAFDATENLGVYVADAALTAGDQAVADALTQITATKSGRKWTFESGGNNLAAEINGAGNSHLHGFGELVDGLLAGKSTTIQGACGLVIDQPRQKIAVIPASAGVAFTEAAAKFKAKAGVTEISRLDQGFGEAA